jgi:hypothetical protein
MASVLLAGQDEEPRDRVLRATFWRPSTPTTTAELIALGAIRAARGLAADPR